ncbi:MAG: hypothetical protein Q3971_01015 [Moraxella sp.]|nr:hypothetical protein [Moraxella sp.]
MLNKIVFTGIGMVCFLTACQSTPSVPVIARADNTFEITGLGSTKLKAQTSALNDAKKHCGSKTPIVISDSTTYNGVIDEKMGRVIEQGVGVLGTVLGATTPNLSRDDDYEYQIKFRCQ